MISCKAKRSFFRLGSSERSTKEMVGLRLGFGCLLQIGVTLANDYAYEVPSASEESPSFQNGDNSFPFDSSSTELTKRQGYHQYDRQVGTGGLVAVIPLIIALGIGGLVAGAAVVQNANQARNNLQSQLDTINTRITTSRATVDSLSSSLPPLSTTINSNLDRSSATCSAIAAGSEVVLMDADNDAITLTLEAIIAAIGAFPCP